MLGSDRPCLRFKDFHFNEQGGEIFFIISDIFFMPKMMYESLLEHNHPLPILTLQEMSLVKIITTLCNHQKLRRLILRCNFHKERNSFKLCVRNSAEWKAVEAMANEMVSQLCKSALIQKRILEYLWPTSYRIVVWKSTYAPRITNSFLQHIHWTERGRIDNTRTARCLIRNRNISVRERFTLACSVCLRNEIYEIWREMSNNDKTYFYNGDDFRPSPLTEYWAHLVAEVDCDSEDYIEEAIMYASKFGLLEAFKYLFDIVPEDRMEFVPAECMGALKMKVISGRLLQEDQIDIACIVFSQMTDDDREDFFYFSFETAISLVLHSRKYKPCLSLLEKRVKSASMNDIARTLAIIFYTYHSEVLDDDECRLLFIEFWRKIPDRIRKAQELRDLRMEFLTVLIRDNFPFILEKGGFQKIPELTSSDFKFSNTGKQVDFHRGKWDFLNFIIHEVIMIPSLKMPKAKVLFFLKKRQSDYTVCYRMFRFITKVRQNLMQTI